MEKTATSPPLISPAPPRLQPNSLRPPPDTLIKYVYRIRRVIKRRIMASSTLPASSSTRSRFKTLLWVSLGLITLFVFNTSEVFLVADYPMYHAYRLQVIADRHLLIPHTVCGTIALLAGPLQVSSRFP